MTQIHWFIHEMDGRGQVTSYTFFLEFNGFEMFYTFCVVIFEPNNTVYLMLSFSVSLSPKQKDLAMHVGC